MPRLTNISKYCVVRRLLAFASSKVYAKLIPSIGVCCTPLRSVGAADAGHLVDRRDDVDHVHELIPKSALVLDLRGPRHDHRVAGAAEVAGHLLGPLEGRVHRVRPGGREVVEVLRPAELVDHLQFVLPLLREAVEEQVLVERSLQGRPRHWSRCRRRCR